MVQNGFGEVVKKIHTKMTKNISKEDKEIHLSTKRKHWLGP